MIAWSTIVNLKYVVSYDVIIIYVVFYDERVESFTIDNLSECFILCQQFFKAFVHRYRQQRVYSSSCQHD